MSGGYCWFYIINFFISLYVWGDVQYRKKRLIHSLWCKGGLNFGAATASRNAEGSGKDRDSFGLDFHIVAAVIPPPWGPLPGPDPDKLQRSIIQLLPLQSCHRAHRLEIPVFSLQTKGLFSGTTHHGAIKDTGECGLVVTARHVDKTKMFPVSWAGCVIDLAAMQEAVSKNKRQRRRSWYAKRSVCR